MDEGCKVDVGRTLLRYFSEEPITSKISKTIFYPCFYLRVSYHSYEKISAKWNAPKQFCYAAVFQSLRSNFCLSAKTVGKLVIIYSFWVKDRSCHHRWPPLLVVLLKSAGMSRTSSFRLTRNAWNTFHASQNRNRVCRIFCVYFKPSVYWTPDACLSSLSIKQSRTLLYP